MKLITLPKIIDTLENELNAIEIPEEVAKKAIKPILRMLEIK